MNDVETIIVIVAFNVVIECDVNCFKVRNRHLLVINLHHDINSPSKNI